MECACQKKDSSATGDSKGSSLPNPHQERIGNLVVIDFGDVQVGKRSSKLVRLQNDSEVTRTFRIKRDPRSNPIYHCFDLDSYEKVVPPLELLELTCTYCCTIPHRKNEDHFNVYVDNLLLYQFRMKAESIGPIVNASIKRAFFYKYMKAAMRKIVVELQNLSKVDATFQFDVNEGEQDVLVVKPTIGTIVAEKYCYVEILYRPREPGQHFAQLPCLIHYHEPIIIEAVGIYSLNEHVCPPKLNFLRYPLPLEDTVGYCGYLSDSFKVRTNIPPVSLSENLLDFGRALPDASSGYLTLVTSVTNHLDHEIAVAWEKDCENVFQISPERVLLPKKQAVLFECHFFPNAEDRFYCKKLTLQAVWAPNKLTTDVTVPVMVSAMFLGHSFPKDTSWIPRLEAPTNVILPSTLPTFQTHNTFVLESLGHLPVLFKFLAPRRSLFLVKPMAGIIRSSQIIVVQLQTVSQKKSGCVEQWLLELNGQSDRRLQIYFKGQAEFPSVLVGTNNHIQFDSIHPGCQGIKKESLRNEVSYPLKYKFFLEDHPYLQISAPVGEIASNETTFLEWYFLSSARGPRKVEVKCELRAVQRLRETVGPPFETHVTIAAECSPSMLCASPKFFSFGHLRFDSDVSTSFTLFNFGKSQLNVLLKSEAPEELKGMQVELKPSRARLGFREKCEVILSMKVREVGSFVVKVFYYLLLSETSDVVVDEKVEIFGCDFVCSWPTVQITDVLDHNFGSLFSCANLWSILNIDEINESLRQIKDDETRTIQMMVPDVENQETRFRATLVVRNFTHFDEEFHIQKQQNCNCKIVPVSVSLTRRKHVYKCTHRCMSNFALDGDIVEANSFKYLTLDVGYLIPGLTKLFYLLTLSHNRTIKLFLNTRTLSRNTGPSHPSKYTSHYDLNFENIYIGEKEPMAKGFWLYNNTEIATNYQVCTETLRKLSKEGEFNLQCLNPMGIIASYWSLPIIFRFIPSKPGSLQVAVPIHFEEEMMIINIKATTSASYESPIKLNTRDPPTINPPTPTVIAPQHLEIPCMSLWSFAEKLIFITNQTQNRTFKYLFQLAHVEGVVQGEACPMTGFLQPGRCQAVVIKVTTFDLACDLQFNVSCKLVDQTQIEEREKSLMQYLERQKVVNELFTVTEKGEYYERNETAVVPEPQATYQTVSVRVRIVSNCDRDLHMSVEHQKRLSPQLDIVLDNTAICSCLASGCKDVYKDLHDKIDKNNSEALMNTISQILRDVTHSAYFGNVVETLKNSDPPYYIQLKLNKTDELPDKSRDVKEYIDTKTREHEDARLQMISDMLNRPRTVIVTQLLQQFILESVQTVFKLSDNQSSKNT